ncbi:MAG: hypothetical protein PHW95_05265 [Patescibacteria group bacterium]|nr:hypothetical protein [Patescibacteria group bacterium]
MAGVNYFLPKSFRRLSFIFLGLSIFVLAFISYMIWARVTIILTPSTQQVDQEFIFQVRDSTSTPSLVQDNVVNGRIIKLSLSGTKSFSATGSKSVESDIVGEVTIVNNYSKEQTLVETTRLALPDNPDKIIVRLKTGVTVLPNSQVKVQVYPDNPADFKTVDAGKLIIPGLWKPLQDKIYATVTDKLTKGGHSVSVVTEADLKSAQEALKNDVSQKTLSQADNQLTAGEKLWPKLVTSTVGSVNFGSKVGDEVSTFTADLNINAVVVAFDETQLISLAREKLKSSASNNQSVNLEAKSFTYAIQDYNNATGEAKIKATVKGTVLGSLSNDLLDAGKVTGMTADEVQSYYSQFPEIKSAEVRFHPAWLMKTPGFKDKISIQVNNQ